MIDLFPFTTAELAAEARREVRYRERVYGRMVADGRMKAHQAERQIAMMQEIAARLEQLDRSPALEIGNDA